MERLRTGEKIAGVGGVALLIIMFAFNWFSVDASAGPFEVSIAGNAWKTMEVIRWFLLLTALAGIALAVVTATQSEVNLPVTVSALAAGIGILTTLLLLYRLIDPPGSGEAEQFGVDISRSLGAFLGLIACAAVAYGSWSAMQDETVPLDD
jgi:hypothetical protein